MIAISLRVVLITLILNVSLQEQECQVYFLHQNISNVFEDSVIGADISPDGKYLLGTQGYGGNTTLSLFTNNGIFFKTIDAPLSNGGFSDTTPSRTHHEFSPDSKTLLINRFSYLTIYDINIEKDNNSIPISIRKIFLFNDTQNFVYSTLSKDGKLLLVSSINNEAVPSSCLYKLQDNGSFSDQHQILPDPIKYQGMKLSPNKRSLVRFTYQSNNQAVFRTYTYDSKLDSYLINPIILSPISFDSKQFDVDLTDNIMVVVGDGILIIFVWKQCINGYMENQRKQIYTSLTGVRITQDESYIVTSSDAGTILIFQKTGEYTYSQEQSINVGSRINDIDITANKQYLVIGTNNKELLIYKNDKECSEYLQKTQPTTSPKATTKVQTNTIPFDKSTITSKPTTQPTKQSISFQVPQTLTTRKLPKLLPIKTINRHLKNILNQG